MTAAITARDNVRSLLSHLGRRGIAVTLESGSLRVRAPLDALDADTLEQMGAARPAIVELLTTHPCSGCGRGSFNRAGVICFWCARSLPDPAT
jgi:hypothetical protein